MNSEILFSLALGLQSPWQVKNMTFSSDESARSGLHLHIDFIPGSRFPDEANVAMNQVRIIERKEHDELKGCQNSSIYEACQYGSRTLVWDCSFC